MILSEYHSVSLNGSISYIMHRMWNFFVDAMYDFGGVVVLVLYYFAVIICILYSNFILYCYDCVYAALPTSA